MCPNAIAGFKALHTVIIGQSGHDLCLFRNDVDLVNATC